ncbi:MAG TPA: SCO family protein [Blastocatellia bacterium]|nr:SCO family protein [Blastocatellia bacterium]
MTLKQQSNTQPKAAQNGGPFGASYFPNVTLTTQDGKTVRFYDDLIKGKVVAINLIYTTCKYNCPLETARLVQVQKMLGDRVGKDIFFYSISIDPANDTPEALKAYAEKYHVGPGWLFLTGKQEDIDLISKKLGLDALPNPNDPDRHMPSLLIGNATTGLWMRNTATDNPRFLAMKIQQIMGWQYVKEGTRAAANLNIDKGEYLFATRCGACHTIGQGDKVGPDLLGVTKTRDRAWLARFIAVPDKVLAEKDPIATALFKKYKEVQMPNLGLHEVDVATLIQYMEARTAALNAAEPATKAGPIK